MCCFSHPVHVDNTRIFARPAEGRRQILVYAMDVKAKVEGAMILPLPVPPGSAEDALKFIDLEGYPKFFEDMAKGFPSRKNTLSDGRAAAEGVDREVLRVVEVGAYEASFVPTVADLERLDPRFRLPEGTFEKLDGYADHGFAVFKLKAGDQKVHPMAFDFPRRDPRSLFFPTVHIHDGEVHEKARFDHSLYCQPGPLSLRDLLQWRESTTPADSFMKEKKAEGTVIGDQHCYVLGMRGDRKNEDVVLRTDV